MNNKRQKTKRYWETFTEGEARRDDSTVTELFMAEGMHESPEGTTQLMEKVCEPKNLLEALRKVKANGGSSGVDGMATKQLARHLQSNWEKIRNALLEGRYKPQAVRRVEIPKPKGRKRQLGIPTVTDRLIQEAILQVIQPLWEKEFHDSSYGFRPRRNAHQAVRRAQGYIREGYGYVVDIDLEKYFDTVNHDKLMVFVGRKIKDKRVMKLIGRYLRCGAVMEEGVVIETRRGTPQGGPLSALLSNIYLNELDKELERRGHRFVRYADDSNIYVKSERAAQRVKENISKYLEQKLKLKVNERKSAAARVQERKFLGFSFMSQGAGAKIRIAQESLEKMQRQIRRLTYRTRGRSLQETMRGLKQYLQGWHGYYGYCETPTVLERIEGWIRRRLRAMIWKQWRVCKHRYQELKKRGVSKKEAVLTAMSSKGPWRISHCRAMQVAYPAEYFRRLGLPRLVLKTL
jgi:RNA-directed DNA polymerase